VGGRKKRTKIGGKEGHKKGRARKGALSVKERTWKRGFSNTNNSLGKTERRKSRNQKQPVGLGSRGSAGNWRKEKRLASLRDNWETAGSKVRVQVFWGRDRGAKGNKINVNFW